MISRIRHRDRRLLLEILVVEESGEQDFETLARQCSEDELDELSTDALPAAIRVAVRCAPPGAVLGPFENRGAWELYKVAGRRAGERLPCRTAHDRGVLERLREVPALDAPSPEAWRRTRENAPGPHLLRGLIETSPLARWSRDYLSSVAGEREVLVEYGVRRISRPDPRIDAGGPLRKPMRFADALSAIETTPVRGVSHYLSAVTLSRWLPELSRELDGAALVDVRPQFSAYLFAGGDGTGTALHYDLSDNYLMVLEGAKDVLLLPPGGLTELDVAPLWLPYCGTSRLGAQAIEDYARRCPRAYWCRVQCGETLFVPLNWWHSIENRGLSVAVARTYAWQLRSLVRWKQARLQIRYSLDAALQKRPRLRRYLERRAERWGGGTSSA